MLRITGGIYRGRALSVPKGQLVRPTSSKVREAIFSIIGSVEGCAILDLCAGAGTLGLEALSRGAHSILFVDKSNTSIQNLKKNIESLGVSDETQILRGKAQERVRNLAASGQKFDIIFLDPPYGRGILDATLQALGEAHLLAPRGVVVAEYDADDDAKSYYGEGPSPLKAVDCRHYGRTVIAFYQREEVADDAGPGNAASP